MGFLFTILGWFMNSPEDKALLALSKSALALGEKIYAMPEFTQLEADAEAYAKLKGATVTRDPVTKRISSITPKPFAGQHGGSMYTGPGAIGTGE